MQQGDAASLVADVAGLAPACLVMTAQGERPLAALAPGELLLTLAGRGAPLKPIRALHQVAGAAIRLAPGALGPMLPLRDLVIGAGQWLRCEGELMPAHLLADGARILPLPAQALILVELDAPDLIVVEGTPLAAMPLPAGLAPPAPGLVAALRATLARRAAPSANPAEALLDRLIGMPEPPHG